jgi:transcriptional regulator with XRE-family HTH domain
MPQINQDLPHPLDIALGQTVRLRRRALRMSQQALADAIGVSFQQVQKYERGRNRISFSRLVEICHTLDCTIADLTDGLDTDRANSRVLDLSKLTQTGADELLCAYDNIPTASQRRAVLDLAKTLSGQPVNRRAERLVAA